jgi:hypothetical protein
MNQYLEELKHRDSRGLDGLPPAVELALASLGLWNYEASDTDGEASTESARTWKSAVSAASDPRDDAVRTVTTDMCTRPVRGSEARHIHDTMFLSHRRAAESDGLPKRTPISLRGPGCSGSMVALCTLGPHVTEIVSNARFGTRSLTTAPFRYAYATTLRGRHRDMMAPHPSQLAASDVRTCQHCGDSQPVDIWHYLFECTGAAPVATARDIIRKVPQLLTKLVDRVISAFARARNNAGFDRKDRTIWASDVDKLGKTAERAALDVGVEVRRMMAEHEPLTGDIRGQWMVYSLVLALPYREMDEGIPHPSFRLPRLVGRMLDAVMLSNAELHPLANCWVQWASWQLKRIAVLSWAAQRRADVDRQRRRSEAAARAPGGIAVE